MGEHRITFLLLARDHVRDEILARSVYLHYGDYMAQDQLFTPRDAWERQHARGVHVCRQLLARLQLLPEVRLLDATYYVHPDVHLRFATSTHPEGIPIRPQFTPGALNQAVKRRPSTLMNSASVSSKANRSRKVRYLRSARCVVGENGTSRSCLPFPMTRT